MLKPHRLLRVTSALVCTMSLGFGPVAPSLLAQSGPATGRIAGLVVDEASGRALTGAQVQAKLITTNDVFTSRGTDNLGGYLITGVPAGIYALTVVHDGRAFPLNELIDARVGMEYLLEACFELDTRPGGGAASLRTECSSGLYAQSQVVSLDPLRYFVDVGSGGSGSGGGAATQQIALSHDAMSCVVSSYFPMVQAGIDPSQYVNVGRVFFRAPPNPDYYYVNMEPFGAGFRAVLPRPAPETREFVYYIEAVDSAFTPVMSPEYTVLVDQCDDDPRAAYYQGEDPQIVLGTLTAGAGTPPGFLPTGIASLITPTGSVVPLTAAAGAGSGGGGIGTLGAVLIVSAVAGATTGIVLAATGEEEASEIR